MGLAQQYDAKWVMLSSLKRTFLRQHYVINGLIFYKKISKNCIWESPALYSTLFRTISAISKEKGKTSGWKRGSNSMAMQPPPLISYPETTSCFSEKIIASTTLQGSINQSEVKLFLKRYLLILPYINSVLDNMMSNMGKYSFTIGQLPTKCKRRMKQWYANKLYETLSCHSAFLIIVRMDAHYFTTEAFTLDVGCLLLFRDYVSFSQKCSSQKVFLTVRKSNIETIETNAAVSLRPVYPRKWKCDEFIN